MDTLTLSGILFAKMIKGGADNLSDNKDIVNELNVFPIPDGDTGDNMYMTIDSGFCAVSNVPESSTLDEISSGAAKGMLLGARGNSGVILSRIFAGIAKGFLGAESADVNLFGKALMCGVDEAYGAVSVPVEGTILTVYKDAVEYANSKITDGKTLEEYFDDFTDELRRSLDRTPSLLAVLREAGVVDSGGAGFVYIAEGMKRALDGDVTERAAESRETPKASRPDLSLFNENSELKYGYCTEFLLQLLNSKTDTSRFDIDALSTYLNSVGDSVVCFLEGTVVKVHVHTLVPGDVLNHCQQYGEYLTLKIENMTLQHNETVIRNRFEAPKKKPHKKYAIVSVASGEGIKNTFTSLGTDAVVDGSQSMNPSTEDFIKAFKTIDAEVILVFPNNSNIVMTAKQAAALYDKADVRVIPSKTIGEGYSAISMLDVSSGDTDAIIADAMEAIEGVVTGLVSKAVRDTEKDGVSVKCGHYIGFVGDTIYTDEPVRHDAASVLAEKLEAGKYDIVLLICGADVGADESQVLYKELSALYPKTEFIMIDGGQPV
ncbi:MAG: DAK2 domain-containing protein, partial [Clostridia bacterium]|nr:DAK2 domain-containing protein [Clostridia bacterium]